MVGYRGSRAHLVDLMMVIVNGMESERKVALKKLRKWGCGLHDRGVKNAD